jgi:hypothetical protein
MMRADVDAFLEGHRIEPGALGHLYPTSADEDDGGGGS